MALVRPIPHRLAGIVSSPSRRQGNSRRRIQSVRSNPVCLCLLIGMTAAVLAFSGCSRVSSRAATNGAGNAADTIRVERRNFSRMVRLHGTVEAVQSKNVIAPRLSGQAASTMIITKLIKNGVRVHRDDVLVEFDRQNQMKNVLDREAEYLGLVEQIKKKQADQTAARAQEETDLKGAEVDVLTAKVDMRTNDVVTGIEAEINKQNLAEAEARSKQLNETVTLKHQAAAADLRILEIQRDRAKNAMDWAQNNIEKMTVKSPLDGLVVLTPVYKGSRYVDPQEGDEVRPGSGMMLVVDPAAMQVRARVNQVDMSYLQPGMSAEVRLDAYPDLVFPGRFDHMGAIGTTSSYSKQIRYFTAIIAIKGSNPKLLPDLTAAADVEIQRLENVLVVPREAIITQQGQPVVEVWHDGRREMRPVKISAMNDCEVVIESGIEEGVVLSRNPRLTGPPTPPQAK
jgi:HlyD family secretion protein